MGKFFKVCWGILKKLLRPMAYIMIGVGIANLTYRYSEEITGIPYGQYSPIFLANGDAVSINISQIKQLKDGKVDLIIREDQTAPFIGEAGMSGVTMISHVIVDCKNLEIAIYRQSAFGPLLSLIGIRSREPYFESPKSVMGQVVVTVLCGITIEQPQRKRPSLIAENREKHGDQIIQTGNWRRDNRAS